MHAEFGAELRRLRQAKGVSQQAVADAVGVQRATVTQWETGRFPPAADRLRRLDEYFQTDELSAMVGHPGEPVAERPAADAPGASLAPVFDRLADRFVHALVRDPKDPTRVGWTQSIGRGTRPSPWSTALAVRTLLLLDRLDFDLDGPARTLGRRLHSGGWSNRDVEVPRPEVTAIVLATLSRIGGGGADLDGAWRWLAGAFGERSGSADRRRPFVISVVLENLVQLRPDDPLVAELIKLLLDLRVRDGDVRAWVSTPAAVEPSVAHTARAVAALRSATALADRPDVAEAVDEGVEWLAGDRKDDGVTEILRIDPDTRGLDVPVDHFTSAHVIRALVGRPEVRRTRLQSAFDALWASYVPAESLWAWLIDGRLPVWMNHDAVVALRAAALAGFSVPHAPHGDPVARSTAAVPGC